MSDWDQFLDNSRSLQGTWEKLSQVAVKGAEFDSRERQPHPKCLEGTRVDLLNYIHGLLDNREENRLVWLHGTAGVGKSAVAFTVADSMKGLKVGEQTSREKRLAGSFFFSRDFTKRRTTGFFFATLVYQLASNFPSVREEVNEAIRENPALLDPDKSLRDQMEALFLRPLRRLHFRLRGCLPLVFVVDALDECTSETELTDLISLLGQALREPDLPVTHILLTTRSEAHIQEAVRKGEVRPLVSEIPAVGVAATMSLDGADVDKDIYLFLEHSFRQLRSRNSDFPQPQREQIVQLASRAGRRFIVASTMMKFIDDRDNDPHDRLELILKLTSEPLPGTEIYKLYDCILCTCADPKRAYLHLSVVVALADPLPISQISKLLGAGQGRDVEATLLQLRSMMDIPTDNSLPVNIYHSSVRDYASDSSNCRHLQVQYIEPRSLLALSSFRLMMQDIPKTMTLLDALSGLGSQSRATQHDPQSLKDSLAFIVQPLEPLSVLIGLLWLQGDHSSDLQPWLGTPDGRAWLLTQGGEDWLQMPSGRDWLQTPGGRDWLQTQSGLDWLQISSGRDWLQTQSGRDWLQTPSGQEWLRIPSGQEWLQIWSKLSWLQTWSGRDWLQTSSGRNWLQAPSGRNWLQAPSGRNWLQDQSGREWLQTWSGREWLQIPSGQNWLQVQTQSRGEWLQTPSGREWLQTPNGREWLQTQSGKNWLQIPSGQNWLQTPGGRECLQARSGQDWLHTQDDRELLETPSEEEWLWTWNKRMWLQTQSGREWLQTQDGRNWLWSSGGREWLRAPGGREWLRTPGGRDWLQVPNGKTWLQTLSGREWLQFQSGREWLQIESGQEWLQTEGGRNWVQTQSGREWLQTSTGREWLRTPTGREWLQSWSGQDWLQTPDGQQWLQTSTGREWLQTQTGREWLQTQSGQNWLHTTGGRHWLRTWSEPEWLQTQWGQERLQSQMGSDWLQTPGGRHWLQTQRGRDWLQTPHGQTWQSTPEASVWATMEEFSSTLEAFTEYILIPKMPLLPAFQVIQQFNNLPDFLMFPVFLALRHQDHPASVFPQPRLPPDMKIIHDMTAFVSFTNEARERSQSASGAFKYACQNWIIHLSRAPKPWDDMLKHTFKAFWNRHLLSWLERQWCLKGLRSCLAILSEGQKLAKPSLLRSLNTTGSMPAQKKKSTSGERQLTDRQRIDRPYPVSVPEPIQELAVQCRRKQQQETEEG